MSATPAADRPHPAAVYSHPRLAVHRDDAAHHRVEIGDGVVVVPLLGRRIVLVGQHRRAVDAWNWELPRGCVDGDDPRDAAARELAEETGAHTPPAALVRLGTLHPDTGLLTARVDVFAARLPPRTRLAADGGEIAALRVVDADALADDVAAGRVTDGFTVAALSLAALAGLILLPAPGR